jgi:hypothetical protein
MFDGPLLAAYLETLPAEKAYSGELSANQIPVLSIIQTKTSFFFFFVCFSCG